MLLITAKKETPVAGQLKEEPLVAKESEENQHSVIQDSQPASSDAENIQTSAENKAIERSITDQDEAVQDKQSSQTSQERTASTKSSENDETPLNPRVVSVGQNEVFCAATGRPCTNPSSKQAHAHNADSASQAETSNSETVDSETRTLPEGSSFDSGSQITNDCSSLENEQNTQSSEHKSDEKTEDEHTENADATVRT